MTKLTMSVICFLLCATFAAQAGELKAVDMTDAYIPNTRVELTMDKNSWEFVKRQISPASIEEILCSGSERMVLPASGECPYRPGYVTVGFAVCTQTFDVPRAFTFQEIAPGWYRMVCTLNYANAVAVDQPSCDYSRCLYVEEPTFVSPQLTIE
ncbi:MAG: hypothetical protein OEU26_23030 [Candidatus Tectomicrobia bacterium]|nr:hypothetical protein [Candidatus Tectomicrobia bacterium]